MGRAEAGRLIESTSSSAPLFVAGLNFRGGPGLRGRAQAVLKRSLATGRASPLPLACDRVQDSLPPTPALSLFSSPPLSRPSMDAFWTLSYPVQAGSPPTSSPSPVAPSETLYLKGPRDVAVVFTCFLLFSALRELSTFLVFKPIARRWVPDAGGGGTSEERAATASRKGRTAERDTRSRSKASVRFAEQGWSVLYYVSGLVPTLALASYGTCSSGQASELLPPPSGARQGTPCCCDTARLFTHTGLTALPFFTIVSGRLLVLRPGEIFEPSRSGPSL